MNRSALVKSGFWITYGTVANRILSLFSQLILARLLLPDDFGVIAVAYIFWSFANMFTQGTSGDFLVYKGIGDKRYVNTTYTISIFMGIGLALGMVAISPLASQFFKVPVLVWILPAFAFNLLLSSLQSVYLGIMKRRMQYREIANAYLMASTMRVVSTTICALLGLSYWSFVIGDTAYWLTISLISHRIVKLKFRFQIDPQAKAEVVSYCLGATGASFGFYVNSNWDNLVAGRMLGSTSLGYYNFAYQITTAFNIIVGQVMSQLGMAVFAEIEEDAAQEKALLTVTEQIAFLAAPIFALFFLVIDADLITLVFGAKWLPAVATVPWLLIFSYFRIVNTPLVNMLSAKGKPGVNAKVNLHIAPIAVLSFIIGAKLGGIVGVAISVAITLGVVWTVYWWWLGCRVLQWGLQKFLAVCFMPFLLAIPAIIVVFQCSVLLETWLPVSLSFVSSTLIEPILFIVLYFSFVYFWAPQQFLKYQLLLGEVSQKILTKAKIRN